MEAHSVISARTPAQSKAQLGENDQNLRQSWRNLTDIEDLRWTPRRDRPATPLDLAYAQSEFAIHLLAHPSLDDASAREQALDYIFQRPETVDLPRLVALYQGVLERGLHWIDLDAVRAKRMSPARILSTVCRHRGQPLDDSLSTRLRNYRDVIADEAALIHFHAQPDCRSQPDCDAVARNTPIHAIRAQFATALIDEWQDASIGMALLPSSPISPAHARFWFDGFSLQNANGKGLQEIAVGVFAGAPYAKENPVLQRFIDRAGHTGHLPGYPGNGIIDAARRQNLIREMHGDMVAMFRYQKRATAADLLGLHLTLVETLAVLAKRMRSLMLGRHYPKCSVLDAVEVTVLRLGPLHGIGLEAFHDPAKLIRAYNKLSRAWSRDPRFVIAPSPYAGQYLTRCRNVLYLTENPKLTRDQQIAVQVAALFLPALVTAMHPASKQRQREEIDFWGKAIWWFQEMPAGPELLAEEDFSPERRALLASVKAGVDVRINAAETIRYANRTDLHRQLHHYMEQEMLTISPLPKYDEAFQVGQILRLKLNMTNHDILTPRSVRFLSATGMGAHVASPGTMLTPVQEFKTRIEYTGGPMAFGQNAIDAIEELEAARQTAAALLMEDPVIHAKSREIMRRHGIAQNAHNEQRIRHSMANSLVGISTQSLLDDFLTGLDLLFGSPTLRTAADAIFSGEPKRILGLLPFIVPAYEIAQGVCQRNTDLLKEGALHFGEDLVLTALGLGAEKILMAQLARDADAVLALRTRMASEPEAVMLQELSERQPSLAGRQAPIAEIAETSFIGGDGAAQTAPKAVADTPIAPDRRVQMTLYLIDEKRWVPVKPFEGGFVETDLRGNVRPGAQIIFGDLALRRGYRVMRRHEVLPAAGAAAAPDVMTTATVVDVLAYRQRLSRRPDIRARRPDPKKIIKALFSLADNAPSQNLRQTLQRIYTRYHTYARFEEFWLRVYRRSDTAVEFLNAAYDKLAFTGNAEINFNAERAHVVGRDVHLLGADALAVEHFVSLGGATPFEWERMVVHEILHALGKTADTRVPGERGETVYLTGRIMFELGDAKPPPTRLAYETPPVFNNDPAAHQLWAEHLLDVHKLTIEQDRVLDRAITKDRPASSAAMILGQKIGERITVRQGFALADHMRTAPKFGNSNSPRLFELAAAAFDGATHSSFPSMLKTMLFGSATARELTYAWLQRSMCAPIEVRSLNFELMDSWADATVSAHLVSGKRIWINTEPLYYFSERGTVALSPLRRHVGAMVDFLIGEIMPSLPTLRAGGRFRNRGIGVLLENEILEQIGDPSAPRICAELLLDPTSYHRHLTTVRRAADEENRLLKQVVSGFQAALGIAGGGDLLGLTVGGSSP